MDRIKKILGTNVAKYRRLRGYKSQEAFSEASSVSVPTVANVERGSSWPEESTIDKIMATLGVTEDQLFEAPDSKDPDQATFQGIIEILTLWEKASPTRRQSVMTILKGKDGEKFKSSSEKKS